MEKVYLAAMYDRRAEMEEIANQLIATGNYEITARWVYGAEEKAGITCADNAKMDIDDVIRAHTVVSFTHTRGTMLPAGGGRHVEFGYGLACGKRMVVIGPQENVFHYHPGVEVYDSIYEWIEFDNNFVDKMVTDINAI